MVTERQRIERLSAAEAVLAGSDAPGLELVVPVRGAVPDWLTDLVGQATEHGAVVLVEAEPPATLHGEALAGWEIGVCTAALAAGAAQVLGIAPQRVARVRAVTGSLATALGPDASGSEVQP